MPRERMSKSELSRMPLSEHFMKACEDKDFQKIKACLTLGVDINCTDEDNHSGLYKVCGDKEIAEFFIQHPDLNVEEVNREDILEKIRDADILQKLCNLPGIDVNAGNPLYWAVLFNNKTMIKILAENPELDWNARDEFSGGYPITKALDWGYKEIVEVLLEQPTLDLNVLTYGGKSVGHCAVECRNWKKYKPEDMNVTSFPIKCVEFLSKDQRVNWNIRDENGDTPIMIALRNKEMEMVRILLKTTGVDLCDIINMKEGKDLIKDLLKEADENNDLLRELFEEADENNDLLKEELQVANQRHTDLTRKVPDCPVCIIQFRSDSIVFQCSEGHFVCGDCYPRVVVCPVCRENMMGRAHGFECFLQDLNF